ncbi:MAG: AraC family transcriptional regulator, partial [Bacteroidota bacterium]
FNDGQSIAEVLLKMKTFELLFHLTQINPNIIHQLLPEQDPKMDLVKIMETHFTKNLKLEEFAHLSGRSLSTFKRDFKKTFSMTPAQWLKKRRLEHARLLLKKTKRKPTEVYLSVGFEDYSHFSRAFKGHFGQLPSEVI